MPVQKTITRKQAEAIGYDRKKADASFKKTVKKYKETGQTDFNTKQETKTKTTQPETIDLRTEQKPQETILDKTKDIPVVGTALKVLASPKTTVVLGGVLAALLTANALTGTIAKTTASSLGRSGTLVGKHIDVNTIGKTLGLTARQTAALAKEVGRRRITEIANTITNPKSAGLMTNILKKTFSGKALALMGGAASTIFLGKWGQAEAGEPLSIVMRDVLKQAEATGDYTLYNEAKDARDEVTNLSAWEKILSNTPFISPFIGIPNKIQGAIKAGAIMDELAKQNQIAAETGESEDDKWARIDAERIEQKEQERIADEEYYVQVAKDAAKAKADARKDDEAYWNNVIREREAYDTAKRTAEEKYWEDVRKANAEIKKQEAKSYEDYGKSQLSFGLL